MKMYDCDGRLTYVHCGAVVRTLLLVPEVPDMSLGWAIFFFFQETDTLCRYYTLRGQRYSLLCIKVKSFLLTLRNGWMDR